jgi:Uma2 family endonuclease
VGRSEPSFFGVEAVQFQSIAEETYNGVMTLEAILEPLERIEIVVPLRDDPPRVFAEVAALYLDRKVELTKKGHIIVMAPAGIEGGYNSGEAFRQLANWARQNKQGKAFDSSAGFFITPNENRSPDAAWVSNERIESIPKAERKGFAPFCPDFAIEVKSQSNNLAELQEKCARYVECGALEAWLVDPETKTVEVYLPSQPRQTLRNVTSVAASGPLSGFVLDLTDIWAGL